MRSRANATSMWRIRNECVQSAFPSCSLFRGTPFSEGPTAERDRRLEVHSPLLLADGSKPKTNPSLLLCRYTPHIILPCYDNFNPTALLGLSTRTCTLYQQKPQRYVLPHLARTRDGDGKQKPLFLDIPIDCIPADKPIHHFNTHSSRKEETIHKFFSWLAATILLCFFSCCIFFPRG